MNILEKLYFTVESVETVIQRPDCIYVELGQKTIYSKNFKEYPNFSIRVIVETVKNHREVKSIHFQKTKKPLI